MDPVVWCQERLWVPHNPISASLLFVDKDQQGPILALRAVHSELAQITELAREPGLAQAKLNWWREALLQEHTHPALEALEAVNSLDAPRYETIGHAWDAYRGLGGLALELEVGMLSGESLPSDVVADLHDLGAAGYWLRQVRDLSADARQGRWFVPLEVQAQYQISRQQVIDGAVGPNWGGFIEGLVGVASERLIDAKARLAERATPAMAHALIMAALDERLAKQLTRAPSRVLTERVLPGHFGNVWAAWRQARRYRALVR
jgi:phytoene synthase